jgi:hypothetical protein
MIFASLNSCKKYSFKCRNPVSNDQACRMYDTNAYEIWVRKSKGKKLLGRSINRLAKQITGKWTMEI